MYRSLFDTCQKLNIASTNNKNLHHLNLQKNTIFIYLLYIHTF